MGNIAYLATINSPRTAVGHRHDLPCRAERRKRSYAEAIRGGRFLVNRGRRHRRRSLRRESKRGREVVELEGHCGRGQDDIELSTSVPVTILLRETSSTSSTENGVLGLIDNSELLHLVVHAFCRCRQGAERCSAAGPTDTSDPIEVQVIATISRSSTGRATGHSGGSAPRGLLRDCGLNGNLKSVARDLRG